MKRRAMPKCDACGQPRAVFAVMECGFRVCAACRIGSGHIPSGAKLDPLAQRLAAMAAEFGGAAFTK